MDEKRKQELKKAFQKAELNDARKKMVLFPDQLRELRGFLDSSIYGLGIACDHTLDRTKEWAEGEGLDLERVLASLHEFGGHCDCEILFNVTPDKFGWPEEE